jgi:hypothetical protein
MTAADLAGTDARALPENAPWTLRRAASFPAGAAGVAFAVFGLQCAGLALCVATSDTPGAVTDRPEQYWRSFVSSNVLLNGLAGYSIAAMAYGVRAQANALRRLRPVLNLRPAEYEAACARACRFHRTPLAFAGAGLSLLLVLLILVASPLTDPFPRPDWDQPNLYWVIWSNVVATWLATRFVLHELLSLAALSRLGSRHARVDLWDPRPLTPFTRRGLESVLTVMIATALLLTFVLGGFASLIVPVFVGLMVAVALLAFFLPLFGVHLRMREAKWRRLDSLHAEIRRREEALEAGEDPARGEAATALPALLALRDATAAAREWPIDLPAVGRLVLYVAIGLGSWLGAALVEHGLESWLAWG